MRIGDRIFIVVVMAFLSTLSSSASAVPVFFSSEALWQAQVLNIESFGMSSANILTAVEVTSAPSPNAELGSTLTFKASNTPLSRSFNLKALQSGASLVFADTDGFDLFPLGGISIGNENDHTDDDWEINLLDGPPLNAFGFSLLGNEGGALPNSFSVFGSSGLLGTTTNIPLSGAIPGGPHGSAFLGVVMTEGEVITRLEFDEASDSDDIGIDNFRFATTAVVPAPSAMLLMGTGLLGLIGWRWRNASSN